MIGGIMSKMFFIDYDDANNDKLNELITKTSAEYNYVILMSNYSASKMIEISKKLNASPYIISNNGSLVMNYQTKEVLINKFFNQEDLKKLITYFYDHEINFYLQGINYIFSNVKNKLFVYITKENVDNLVKNYNVYQIMIDSKNVNRMLTIPAFLKDNFKELKIVEEDKNHKYYLIGRKDASRSNGIYEIMDKLKLGINDIVIVGKTSEEFKIVVI